MQTTITKASRKDTQLTIPFRQFDGTAQIPLRHLNNDDIVVLLVKPPGSRTDWPVACKVNRKGQTMTTLPWKFVKIPQVGRPSTIDVVGVIVHGDRYSL